MKLITFGLVEANFVLTFGRDNQILLSYSAEGLELAERLPNILLLRSLFFNFDSTSGRF